MFMPHNWRIISIGLISLGVSACGMMPPQKQATGNNTSTPSAPVEAREISASELAALATIRWWLDYQQSISTQTQKLTAAEYKSAESSLIMDASLHNRLRMITLLSVRGTPFHNPERALKILDEIIADPHTQSKLIRDSASLAKANILSSQQDQKKIQALMENIKELQNNNTAIQNQLDALKEIERSIYERRKVEVTNKQ